MSAVYRRELKANLCSMTGAIFIAYVLLFLGLYCANFTFKQSIPNIEYAIINVSFLSLLAVPVLTMKSFSEERHSKTDQLLYSLPISTSEIVLGKFFAMATVFAVPVAVLCLYPLVTASMCSAGHINFATAYGTIFCYYLLGCAVIAVCMFLSTLTESQVIAAIFSIGAILLLFFMSSFAQMIPSDASFSLVLLIVLAIAAAYILWLAVKNYYVSVGAAALMSAAAVLVYLFKPDLLEGFGGKLFAGMSVFSAMDNFYYGVFDITAIVYYISAAALFVFFTVQSVEKRRWS